MEATRYPELCEGLIEAAPDALIVVDVEGRILVWNTEAERMFGYRSAEILDHLVEELLPQRFRASHALRRSEFAAEPKPRPLGARRDLFALRRDGTEFAVDVALSPLPTRFGMLTVASVRDATERRAVEEKLRYLSGHDSLTGICNRHAFEEERTRLGRGRRFPTSIVVIDLDGLKEINDTLGHAAGDRLLRRAAGVLSRAFRAEDTVARLGGDEFAALLPATSRRAAVAATNRVARLLREENEHARGPALQLSIGVATAADRLALKTCLRKADAAMYRDKVRHHQKSPAPERRVHDADERKLGIVARRAALEPAAASRGLSAPESAARGPELVQSLSAASPPTPRSPAAPPDSSGMRAVPPNRSTTRADRAGTRGSRRGRSVP